MINTGTSLASLAYKSSLSSAYSSTELMPVDKSKEDTSVAKTIGAKYPDAEINDEVVISDEANELLAKEQANSRTDDAQAKESKKQEQSTIEDKALNAQEELTPEQESQVSQLKAIDLKVKAHEQAHLAAAAGINASAPSYSYETGPDGEKYAVGGEVSISFSLGEDPEANIAKAQAAKAAALAPADPSGQDMSVARSAEQIIAQARQDLAEQKNEESSDGSKPDSTGETSGTVAVASQEKQDDISEVGVGFFMA